MILPVGVSEHIGQDMLMGKDVPHFRQLIKKELERERERERERAEEKGTNPTWFRRN